MLFRTPGPATSREWLFVGLALLAYFAVTLLFTGLGWLINPNRKPIRWPQRRKTKSPQ